MKSRRFSGHDLKAVDLWRAQRTTQKRRPVSSLGPRPQISCARQVFASPDGTLAVFGACPELIQIGRFD